MWHFRREGPGSGRKKRGQASLSVKILSLCRLLQIPAWVTFNLWTPSEETDTMGNTMCPSLGSRAGHYSCPSFGGIFSVWLGPHLIVETPWSGAGSFNAALGAFIGNPRQKYSPTPYNWLWLPMKNKSQYWRVTGNIEQSRKKEVKSAFGSII